MTVGLVGERHQTAAYVRLTRPTKRVRLERISLRPHFALLVLHALALFLVNSVVAQLPARDPVGRLVVPDPVPSATIQDFLLRAGNHERNGHWQQAADLYERAVRYYPDNTDLKTRWRFAERTYSLQRRYLDPSYAANILTLDLPRSSELYREVLRKIDTYYVQRVSSAAMGQCGFDQLFVALAPGSPFCQANFPHATVDQLAALRHELALRRDQIDWRRVVCIEDVVAIGQSVAELCETRGCRRPSAALLEFVAAAGESLDPYSSYLSPNRLRDLYAIIDGSFVGLGVEVRHCPSGLEVIHVLPSSPAKSAGIESGDTILAVDDVRLQTLATEDAANRLQGPIGSMVKLDLLKKRTRTCNNLVLMRREVTIASVTEPMVFANTTIGYVRLLTFQKQTGEELREAVTELKKQGMHSLILDLRGNPGGLLDVGIAVANDFISQGLIVRTEGRAWGQTWTHEARASAVWDFPLVVLIDGDSASASEILAGALKDSKRATLVGTRSYGKGSVQSIFPLRSAQSGLRLTTAKFFSPKGKAYEGMGIMPDVWVARANVDPFAENHYRYERPDAAKDEQLAAAIAQLNLSVATAASDSAFSTAR